MLSLFCPSPPQTAFHDTILTLLVGFIWQGRQGKHLKFVYGRFADGKIGIQRFAMASKPSGYPSFKISSEAATEKNHDNVKSQTSEDIENSLMQKRFLS
jgi:hypothetical protein